MKLNEDTSNDELHRTNKISILSPLYIAANVSSNNTAIEVSD